MDFNKRPGKEIKTIGKLIKTESPTISIVTPFYNGGETLDETANSVFSQTYPFFEWIIVDDGSKDKDSLKKLDEVSKKDSRIRVFHKENGGPSQARDFGIQQTLETTKYVLFLDCDDIMDNTMLECMYWTLETHPEASFTYTSMINFGAQEYYWEPYFTLEQQKVANIMCICSMVKKSDLLEVGCFGVKEKAMYEDWNLWLKLLAKGKIPIRMNAPVFWYRTNNTGEFSRAKQNHQRAMKLINETVKTIKEDVKAIQFPRIGGKVPTTNDLENMVLPQYKKNNKKTILFIFPWTVVGGADIFNLELIKRLDKTKYNCIVLTTAPMKNVLRQKFEEYVMEFYDMSNFLDHKDYPLFVDYLVGSRNVTSVFVSNTALGYALLPGIKQKYPHVTTIDYVHSIDLVDTRGGFGKYTKEFDEVLDFTFTCNNFTLQQLKKDYKKVNAKTIYIGTDHEKFDIHKYDVSELKKEYKIPSDKKVVSFIARLSYEKRPMLFLEIAKKLLKQNNDLIFLIAGDGPLYDEIKENIDKFHLQDKIRMLGMVSESEKVFAVSDVTINCSLLEGLALTSYESLSMGVPVVSANVGGQAELINDKVGRIIPFMNYKNKEELNEEANLYVGAVNDILNHLDSYKEKARKRILDGFTLDAMVEKFDEIFSTQKALKTTGNFASQIYTYYASCLHGYFEGLCTSYYEKYLHVIHDEIDTNGRFASLKRKFKQISMKYYVEDEMYFVFKTLKHLYRAILYIVGIFVELIKFIIMFLPACFHSVHILIRICRLKSRRGR